MNKIENVPELHSRPEDVPLRHGEKTERIIVRTTADGGYVGNHFEVAIGTRLSLIGFDKTDMNDGEISWFHRAHVNSRMLREYITTHGADTNILMED